MSATKIAIIGVGKIAIDQHIPVIGKNADFELVGLVSQRGLHVGDTPSFKTAAELFAAIPEVEAVAICTPPHVRHNIAREALAAGKHVLLEKPPTATVAEMHDLTTAAREAGRVIFSTWHSQYNPGIDAAKARLAGQKLKKLHIEWREDVRRWHPGQDWIWEAGNFGVFDTGINALSVLTKITPGAMFVKSATLEYPANRDTPIAASLVFSCNAGQPGAALTAEIDWRQEDKDIWNIEVVTERETLLLTYGGSKLYVDGKLAVEASLAEYEGVYDHFAALLKANETWMDSAPFQLVADTFLIASRRLVAPFHW